LHALREKFVEDTSNICKINVDQRNDLEILLYWGYEQDYIISIKEVQKCAGGTPRWGEEMAFVGCRHQPIQTLHDQ
jgi:hypothetical protein